MPMFDSDLGEAISCKLGTVPKLLYARDKRTPLEVGRIIRVKERRGDKWQTVIVREIQSGGHFFADLI